MLSRPDGDGTKSLRFMYDTDGRLVSETARRDDRRAVNARDLIWLGAPREARDEDGTVVWRWDSDAFGTGPGGSRQAGVQRDPDGDGVMTEVSLRFPGQYHDRESGLFYNHHRDYDPVLGRYVQSDPVGLGGGVNRFAYVSGDPVNFIDPMGLTPKLRETDYSTCFATDDGVQCSSTGGGGGSTGVSGGHEAGPGDPGDGLGPGAGGGNFNLDWIFTSIARDIVVALINNKLCSISKNISNGTEAGQDIIANAIEDILVSSPIPRDSGGSVTHGYSIDLSIVASNIVGGLASVGVWGDNSSYGYTLAVGPVAGTGVSGSAGVSSSWSFDDAQNGIRVMAGASGGLLLAGGFEVGAGTQYVNTEANVGIGTPTAYAGFQYVYVKKCE